MAFLKCKSSDCCLQISRSFRINLKDFYFPVIAGFIICEVLDSYILRDIYFNRFYRYFSGNDQIRK